MRYFGPSVDALINTLCVRPSDEFCGTAVAQV